MNVGVKLMLLLYTVLSSSMMWFSACCSVLLAGVALGFYFFCIIVPHSTKLFVILLAPLLARSIFQESVETGIHLDPLLKEVAYNPTFETMFAPEVTLFGYRFMKEWHVKQCRVRYVFLTLPLHGFAAVWPSKPISKPADVCSQEHVGRLRRACSP